MASDPPRPLTTVLLTSLALVAFALNSVLCRQALGPRAIDAASFTTLRVASGAATLVLISRLRRKVSGSERRPPGFWSPAALFVYAACFSFAYLSLTAGTGALILFGSVQITMMFSALKAGERPTRLAWLGYTAALGGMVYLVAPGVQAPSPTGALLD